MRSLLIAAFSLSLASACQAQEAIEIELSPDEIASATASDWRDVDAENLILIEAGEGSGNTLLDHVFVKNVVSWRWRSVETSSLPGPGLAPTCLASDYIPMDLPPAARSGRSDLSLVSWF